MKKNSQKRLKLYHLCKDIQHWKSLKWYHQCSPVNLLSNEAEVVSPVQRHSTFQGGWRWIISRMILNLSKRLKLYHHYTDIKPLKGTQVVSLSTMRFNPSKSLKSYHQCNINVVSLVKSLKVDEVVLNLSKRLTLYH